MRLGLRSTRSTIWLLVVVTGVATIALTAYGSLAAHAGGACVVMSDLNEEITNIHEKNPNGAFPAVGGVSSYTDYLYDAGGKLLITDDGRTDVGYKDAKGHIWEFGFETMTLSDGAFEDGGQFDITNGFNGDWVSVPAVGTAGRYLGLAGERRFRLVIPGKLLKAEVRLCRP